MGKLFNVHPSDDQLDVYLVGHLSFEDERLIEEHYFGCATCLDRLSAVKDFIAVLKTTLQADDQPSVAEVPRKRAKFAPMLLICAGSALLYNAPALVSSGTKAAIRQLALMPSSDKQIC
jgi:hypothetical protein